MKTFLIELLFIGIIAGAFGIVLGNIIIDTVDPTPSAIDVYRNKTTLQITYKNNIPVDTVVVFK